MLKDVGMTVPKSRETSAVYVCSNTGDEASIIESVDSICRDGADTPISPIQK